MSQRMPDSSVPASLARSHRGRVHKALAISRRPKHKTSHFHQDSLPGKTQGSLREAPHSISATASLNTAGSPVPGVCTSVAVGLQQESPAILTQRLSVSASIKPVRSRYLSANHLFAQEGPGCPSRSELSLPGPPTGRHQPLNAQRARFEHFCLKLSPKRPLRSS